MTKVTVFRNHQQEYLGFECFGHAGFADAGKDVVCAGISALVINTVNALEQFTDEKFFTEFNQETGKISLRFQSLIGHDAELLMNTLVLGLQGIQNTYGTDYIHFIFKEVQ